VSSTRETLETSPGASRGRSIAVWVLAALIIAAGAAVLGVALSGSSEQSSLAAQAHRSGAPAKTTNPLFAPKSTERYGGAPSFLPRIKHRVGVIVDTSLAAPALAIEGETLRASLPGATSLVTTVGPAVPHQGTFPVPKSSPCTFYVTFARTRGSIPLSPSDFVIKDEYGALHRPLVSTTDGAPLPKAVSGTLPVTLRLYTVLPAGSGAVLWSVAGRPAASWDFAVEID